MVLSEKEGRRRLFIEELRRFQRTHKLNRQALATFLNVPLPTIHGWYASKLPPQKRLEQLLRRFQAAYPNGSKRWASVQQEYLRLQARDAAVYTLCAHAAVDFALFLKSFGVHSVTGIMAGTGRPKAGEILVAVGLQDAGYLLDFRGMDNALHVYLKRVEGGEQTEEFSGELSDLIVNKLVRLFREIKQHEEDKVKRDPFRKLKHLREQQQAAACRL